MVGTLPETKRAAIAEKLADMRAVQNLIVSNEQQFLKECQDADIRDRLEDMLEDDRKNLGILETVITEYGIQSKPKETVNKMVQQAQQMMSSSELDLYEKMAQHELLKHGQVMSGLVVHKAAQIAEADIKETITPIHTVNFENRAHQEQLKGILEVLGTRKLTGQEPEQGLWGRVQDAISAMTGAVGSAVTQTSDQKDLRVQDVIRADHQRVRTLFGEIKRTDDASKRQEYFDQLYSDLIVHSKAEEQVVYPKVKSFFGESNTQELYDEQAELEKLLNEMRNLSPMSDEFMGKLNRVREVVRDHTTDEEVNMFASIRKHCTSEQQQQMSTEFKEVKKQLQTKMAG
ncbi:MAG: hemerythrin domain-containing protein [Synechococcales bacterium]|nr:hemerythrin domain-containing protein [Synechococcales bacterium]